MSQRALFPLPVPPFRLDLTVCRLRRRPDDAADRWDGQTYRRALPLSSGLVDIAVTQIEPPETPQYQVTCCWTGTGLRKPDSRSQDHRSRKRAAVNYIDFQDAVFTGDRTDGTRLSSRGSC
jgi:hypothetical protein